MTDRNIFNRSYTSFDSNGSEVWLVNGGGITSNYTSPYVLFAGENLSQGDVVYASGNGVAVKATAFSGVDNNFYFPIGLAATSATAGTEVQINLDGVVVLDGSNITDGSTLIPGQDYFLSKYKGQVTLYATGSGVILASGLNQYGAAVRVGRAVSPSELEIEIQPPILLVN